MIKRYLYYKHIKISFNKKKKKTDVYKKNTQKNRHVENYKFLFVSKHKKKIFELNKNSIWKSF